ncbi:MAG: hypothetical protein OEO21_03760 [Candidatus Krumholzibacteria bacterium]|nr:hypothetical protein [Candidatus Krumholzibacteria bacterium]
MSRRARWNRLAAACLAACALYAPAARAGEIVVNGGFETGTFGAAWVHGAFRGALNDPNLADHAVVLDLPYAGSYSALLGFKYTTQTTGARGYMYQTVSIPAGVSSATLEFKMRMQGYDSSPYDPFRMDIRDTGGGVLRNVLTYSFTEWNDRFKDGGWVSDDNVLPAGHDVSAFAGQTVQLYFEQANTIDALYETWTYVDDVSLVYRMWVDLAADGDGDDVFGAPGTGAGGLATRSGVAGDTLVYALTVENEGNVADSYQLTAASVPAGWTVLVDMGAGWQALPAVTAALAPGATALYAVAVISPAAAPGGSYDVVIDAVSTAQGSRNDSATLRASVVDAVYAVDAVVNGNGVGVVGDGGAGGFSLVEAPWDSTVNYAVVVFNTGNAATAFSIDWGAGAGLVTAVWYNAVRYTTPFVTTPVAPGANAGLQLEVTGPAPEPGGDHTTILVATAVNDALRRDSIRAILRLRAPRVDMIITTSGDGIYDPTLSGQGGVSSNAGEQGVTVSFPVIVQNEGAISDAYDLSWTAPGAGWSAVITIGGTDYALPVTTPVLPPFSQQEYILRVTVPGAATFGTYASILNAVSVADNRIAESVSAVVSVASAGETDMTIDGNGLDVYGPIGTGLGGSSTQTVMPGDTAVFTIVIENVLGTNSFEVSWNTPPGWQVTLGGSASPISALPAGTYALEVIVPPSSLGGTFDIILDAHKSDKIFFMDSVTGRVVVLPPAVVDGVIDGDGDGLYGATGTGAGGTSLQTTAAGVTLNYTVELQNEGSTADRYVVTWNTIAGWTATFDGGASPYLTIAVPAGGAGVYTFAVTVPAGAALGSYAYIVDIVSWSDPTSFESLAARVDIAGPPRADLVIDGNGLNVFGPLGSGQGGVSTRAAAPGGSYNATLRARNAGAFADSFRVAWTPPTGWPAGSVVVWDGGAPLASPFWTPVILPGQYYDYTVVVQVPLSATASHTAIIDAWSSLPPNRPESIALVTETRALLRGVVFDDRDHDGVPGGATDAPLPGVTVFELGSGATAITDGAGRYEILVAPGSVTAVERNPSGFVSLTPDTLGPFVLAAGDTATADFGDIGPLALSPGGVLVGLAGSYVDFAHIVTARTAGQVTLTATNAEGATTMFMLDQNANGVFDGADRALVPADLALDPDGANGGVVYILARVFIPAAIAPGTTLYVALDAEQLVSATAIVLTAAATDAVVVSGSALGRLSLQKSADRAGAAPGEVVTYAITFLNAGTDSLQNLVLLDPVSPWVDIEPDAFGPGQDVEWQSGTGPPVYLTYNPADVDECEYSGAERIIRWFLSKNSPFYVAPGESGSLTYRVRVR